jgi:hypothetical protein
MAAGRLNIGNISLGAMAAGRLNIGNISLPIFSFRATER